MPILSAVVLQATEPVDPGLLEACGSEPGTACRFAFEHTSNVGFSEAVGFLVSKPLRILLICLVAWITVRVLRRVIRRFTARLSGSAQAGNLKKVRDRAPGLLITQGQPSLRSAARAETIGQVLRSITSIVVYGYAAIYVLDTLGVKLGPLIAGAGIVGIALGFGAQSLVKDFLSGIFMLIEDQYGVGDVVDLGEAVGTVEAVSLRTTRVRDVNGTVWHVPNGQILRVGNKSQQWARALLDIVVAQGADVDRAQEVLAEVAQRVCTTEPLSADVLEEPEVWGVEQLGPEGITIRLVVKTRPGAQFDVMRALRVAAQEGLAEAGIAMPAPPGTLTLRSPAPDGLDGGGPGDQDGPDGPAAGPASAAGADAP